MITQRLQSIAKLCGKYELLERDEVLACTDTLRPFVRGSMPLAYDASRRFDGCEVDTSAIADWIRAQGLGNQRVTAIWLPQQEGINVAFYDFLDFLDELWYPSADDVLMEPESETFVLVIDHEEQVQLFLRGKPNGTA